MSDLAAGRLLLRAWEQPPGREACDVHTTEGPNAHHVVSKNASATEPASILVVFVADDGATLTTPDKR